MSKIDQGDPLVKSYDAKTSPNPTEGDARAKIQVDIAITATPFGQSTDDRSHLDDL